MASHASSAYYAGMAIGLYQSGNGWARVRYPDGTEMDVRRDQYEAQDYQPPFDELPPGPEAENA